MPFDPNPVTFRVGDQDKEVAFSDQLNSPKPWNVVTVTFATPTRVVRLDEKRWTFPTVVKDPVLANVMRGTLHYNGVGVSTTATVSADRTLAAIWPTVAGRTVTLAFDISCDGVPQTLNVLLSA